MEKKTKKTLRDLVPKPVTKASRRARARLIASIDITPSGKELLGGRRTRHGRRIRNIEDTKNMDFPYPPGPDL